MNKYLLRLIQGSVVIRVRDFKDFAKLKRALEKIDMLDELVRKPEMAKIDYWRELASLPINQRLGRYLGFEPLYFEYQPEKGFTFSWDEKSLINWWGKENIINAYLLEEVK